MFAAFRDTLRGALAFGISSSLVSAIGFILIPLYTRYLSVEEFGLLGLVSLTASVATAIFGLGLNSAIFRSYFDYDDKTSQRRLAGTALLVAGAGSGSLILLATLCSESFIAQRIFGVPGTGKFYQIALYAGAIGLLNVIPLAIYRADRQFGRFATFNIIAATLQMMLIIGLVVVFRFGLMGIVTGQLAAMLIVNGLLLYSVRTKVEIVLLRDEVRKLLSYGLPLVPGGVFYLLLTSGGLYFVQTTQGLAEVGIFNLAIKIASVFSILVISPFQLVWPPMMFSVEKSGYSERFYANMLVYALYVSVGIGMLLSVFAREIIETMATPTYTPAALLVGLLVFGHILFVAQNVFNVGVILKRKTAYWSAALVIETIVCILMWLSLAPNFGVVGIAISSIIGYGVGTGVTLLFSRRFLRVGYEWKRVLFLIVLFPLAVSVSYALPNFPILLSLVVKTALVLLLLGSPFLFQFWHPDEIAAAKRLLRQVMYGLRQGLSTAAE